MRKLTNRQQQILSFVRIHTAKTGEGPTVREIGNAFGFASTNGVYCHLKAIEAKERLKRCEFMPRGLELEVVDNMRMHFCGLVS